MHFILIEFYFVENAKPRSILNDMIVEAHTIREVLVDSQMANNLQARQNQLQTEETVSI